MRRFAILGVVLGLLLLTKLSALPMLAVIPAVAYVVRRRAPAVSLAALACVAALAICGWHLVDNTIRYGDDPLAASASERYLQPLGVWAPSGRLTKSRVPFGTSSTMFRAE
jgi:4-amino-4-deoxy-L-arabinose transferase-like glycosyltransferase